MTLLRASPFWLSGLLLILPGSVFAQDVAPAGDLESDPPSEPLVPHGEAPAPAPVATPAPTPEEPAGAPSAAPAPSPSTTPICLLGVGRGDANAETAASLLCEKLREQGVQVSTVDEEIPAPGAYRVHLRPLGSLYYLELVKEAPVGQVVASRRLQIGGLEEVPAAAQRLVEALVNDVPIEGTARAHSLVSQETSAPKVRSTHTRFSLGVAGVMVGTDLGYGADMAFGFVGTDYGSQIRLRGAGGDAGHVSLVVSGWRYFGQGDIAPFLGLGFGMGRLSDDEDFAKGGLLVEPVVGVELFRFDSSRLQVTVALDIPLFRLERFIMDAGMESRYVLGGGLGVAYIF